MINKLMTEQGQISTDKAVQESVEPGLHLSLAVQKTV